MWNGYGDAETIRAKNAVIDWWCGELGRDPREIDLRRLEAADFFSRGLRVKGQPSAHPTICAGSSAWWPRA